MSTVLVVDDESDVLRLVETVLTRDGHKVSTALSGDKALDKIRKSGSAPDLLLADVVMPGLSGPMLAERLRETYPNMRVLFMSAYEDRQVVRRYVKDPGFALIAKPFQIQELSSKVQELLDSNADAAVT